MLSWYIMVVAASSLLGGSTLYLLYVYLRGVGGLVPGPEVSAMLVASPLSLATVLILGWKHEWFMRRPNFVIRTASVMVTLAILVFVCCWLGLFQSLLDWVLG